MKMTLIARRLATQRQSAGLSSGRAQRYRAKSIYKPTWAAAAAHATVSDTCVIAAARHMPTDRQPTGTAPLRNGG